MPAPSREKHSSILSGVLKGPTFASPVSTSLDELVQMRSSATAMQRRVKKRSASQQGGNSVSRRLGRGLDFAEVREYQPGDDVRMIDWKVTARSGRAHTKLFVEERERPVLLFVDYRRCMRFGTQGMYKSVLAARLAALLGWCAVSGRDRVGGFVFTDDWHAEVRPAMGRRGLMSLFRAIVESQMHVPMSSNFHFSDMLEKLARSAQSGSTVVLLSDFHDFDESATKALGRVLHTLDMVAVHISDPLDYKLPGDGRLAITSSRAPGSETRLSLAINSTHSRRDYRQRFDERLQAVSHFFAQGRHTTIQADTAAPLIDTAVRILQRK